MAISRNIASGSSALILNAARQSAVLHEPAGHEQDHDGATGAGHPEGENHVDAVDLQQRRTRVRRQFRVAQHAERKAGHAGHQQVLRVEPVEQHSYRRREQRGDPERQHVAELQVRAWPPVLVEQ
jgi:hypothetical protein